MHSFSRKLINYQLDEPTFYKASIEHIVKWSVSQLQFCDIFDANEYRLWCAPNLLSTRRATRYNRASPFHLLSQLIPENPAKQEHVYELWLSKHVPPFLQGLLRHLLSTAKVEKRGDQNCSFLVLGKFHMLLANFFFLCLIKRQRRLFVRLEKFINFYLK